VLWFDEVGDGGVFELVGDVVADVFEDVEEFGAAFDGGGFVEVFGGGFDRGEGASMRRMISATETVWGSLVRR